MATGDIRATDIAGRIRGTDVGGDNRATDIVVTMVIPVTDIVATMDIPAMEVTTGDTVLIIGATMATRMAVVTTAGIIEDFGLVSVSKPEEGQKRIDDHALPC